MTEHTVLLPLVMNNYTQPVYDPPNQNKGIALVEPYLQDLDSVGATWYYTWTHYPKPKIDPRYIPMSYYGLFDGNLPVDYNGFVLFLNEPNSQAPFGSEISPSLAAERYALFVQAQPNAKLIVGNCSAWSVAWYMNFIIAVRDNYDVPLPKYIGVHGYVEDWITAPQLDLYWSDIKRVIEQVGMYQIEEMWVTEFADTTGDTASLTALMDVIQSKPYITKFAYFTNRYDPTQPYIPAGWHDFNLINSDGTLSPIGLIYAQR